MVRGPRCLNRPQFGWVPPYAEEVVAQLIRIGELVEPREAVSDIADDPDDNRSLEAAAEGEAELIVSGDRHLLALGSWRDIPIVEPAEFPADA